MSSFKRQTSITARARRVTRYMTALVAAAVVTGCMMFARAPKDLDYSRTRTSGAGLYRATIRPQGDSIPQGKLHRWVLHVETPNGAPVDACQIAVDGGMPQHGHGLPTKPVVTRDLGNGDHLVEGMKFNMGGWWVVRFAITSSAATDTVTINLSL